MNKVILCVLDSERHILTKKKSINKYIIAESLLGSISSLKRTPMAGNLRIMSIFGSTFGPFGGLCNTAESFGL